MDGHSPDRSSYYLLGGGCIGLRTAGLDLDLVATKTLQQPKNQPNPPNDMHAPIAIAPQRRLSFRPNFIHLFRFALTRSRCHQLPKANRVLARLALLVGGRPRDAPLPPSNCAKIALAGATPSPKPPQDFFSRIPSDGRGFRLPYRQIVASPHFLFVCVLAWATCSSDRRSISSS
jgi:hypothetical protein